MMLVLLPPPLLLPPPWLSCPQSIYRTGGDEDKGEGMTGLEENWLERIRRPCWRRKKSSGSESPLRTGLLLLLLMLLL